MKDLSAEELVRMSRIGFCCYTPAECEEIEADLLSRLKAGERAVKAMEAIFNVPRTQSKSDWTDQIMKIIDQWRQGNE